MSEPQVAAPIEDNVAAVVPAAKEGSLLTGEGEGTNTPLAEGTLPELPHAWMSGLTTEQKADADLIKSVSKFEKGIPDLVRSYAELEKKQSQIISVPNETATEEEKARYRKAIGVPDKLEDYKLEKVELPEGLTIDEAMQKDYLKIVHTEGLNDAQVNAIHKWYMKTIGEQVVAAQKIVKTTKAEAVASLQKKYGADYDAGITYMERAFNEFATPHVQLLFDKSGMSNEPAIIEMFIKMGKVMGDHKFADGSRGEHLETGTVGQRSFEQIAESVYPPEK